MRTLVLPYKQNSMSAKEIAKQLGIKRVSRRKDLRLKVDVMINWGCSNRNLPVREIVVGKWINHPDAVANCVNKNVTTSILKKEGVSIIPSTLSWDEANMWLKEGHTVFCRTSLTGHSGQGIVVAHAQDELVRAPLYTLGLMGGEEYRIHVVDGKVIDQRQKKIKKDFPDEDRNPEVKSYKNGYVFAMNGIDVPESIDQTAILAVKTLGLDFGAVDMLYYESTPYVIEVNTSCGLRGSTRERYREALKELINY